MLELFTSFDIFDILITIFNGVLCFFGYKITKKTPEQKKSEKINKNLARLDKIKSNLENLEKNEVSSENKEV